LSDTSEEIHPLLIADLADEESCAILQEAAAQRAVVVVPLMSAPVDLRVHLLEVYVAGGQTPRRFIVEPAGTPVPEGFPLRFAPHGEPTPPAPWDDDDDLPTIARPGAVRARSGQTSPSVSRGHTRDLDRRGAAGRAIPSPVDDPHTGRALANGKYRLDALVGAGGMGAVYRAHHRDLDKVVAVKLLHPTFLKETGFSERFQAEALTMSRIDHPNVARVLDFGQEPDGLLYLVMEFLDGVDLAAVREEAQRLDVERIARIMTQVCAALGHVHRHGIIHRDVKPTNILLVAGHDEEEDVPTEIAKVCDFGIALTGKKSGGRTAGTPDYMSPEQCRGLELDARSDVYACGVILFELSTGRMPFEGQAHEVMQQHIVRPPPPPSTFVPDIDPLLEAIVLKAMAKDPESRQPSMRHLRNELRELLAPVLVSAPSSEPSSEPSKSASSVPPHSERIGTSTMPRRMSGGERWLGEDGASSSDPMFVSLGGLVERDAAYDEGDLLARALAKDAGPWLNELAATMDGERFGEKAKVLQIAVKKLLKDANADALVPIVATLRRIIKEEREPTNPRVKWSGRVLRALRDPPKLSPIVDRALAASEEPSRAIAHILVETQAAGAEALVEGRKSHRTPAARMRFVVLVRPIGAAALGPVRTALQDVLANGERTGPLVEDLLRAIPAVPDEATGTLVATLLRGAPAATAAAALVAISGLWGERARPLLMGALGTADTDVRIAALTGLRVLKGLDAMVVRHVAPIVAGVVPATEDLRIAAAAALAEVSADARAEAANILGRAFARPANPRAAPSAGFLIAVARSLVTLGVPNAAALVRDRAERAPDPIKRQLLALLAR
jgi:eukaryotic-like serine/threonine-protein kinase